MKKKVLGIIFISLTSTAMAGCNFFDTLGSQTSSEYISSNEVVSIDGDGSVNKQTLKYTIDDLIENNYYSLSNIPSIGNPKILVVPILFKDSGNYLSSTDLTIYHDKIEKAIFGTNEETGWYSVSSYYYEESAGKCHIEGTVAPWYQSTYSYSAINDSNATTRLIKEAVDNWKNKNRDQVKSFDTDEDGYLDGVIAIYGGPNYKNTTGTTNENMWAYTSWTDLRKDKNNPNVKNYIWASYDFVELDTTYCTIDAHTYIHETGHLFGLDDIYDYNASMLSQGRWAGAFSMQDYNVGGHDPYSLLLFGWANPYVPTESCEIEIKPFVSSKDLILLTPEYTASPFDEYLLIEYYTPTGVNQLDANHAYCNSYPSGLTRSGIRLWHVDSRLLDVTNARSTSYEDNGSGYKLFSNYVITSNITKNHTYVIGPTNTIYRENASKNAYSTTALELRDYPLLELIRCNDYSGRRRGEAVDNFQLFGEQAKFTLSDYSAYFGGSGNFIIKRDTYFNNGKTFPWTMKVSSITSEKAVITLTKDE